MIRDTRGMKKLYNISFNEKKIYRQTVNKNKKSPYLKPGSQSAEKTATHNEINTQWTSTTQRKKKKSILLDSYLNDP